MPRDFLLCGLVPTRAGTCALSTNYYNTKHAYVSCATISTHHACAFYNRPETTHQHIVEARYRSVYFGWQQSNRVNGCRGEEQALLSQLNAVKNASHGRASTVAYTANAQSLLTFYGAIRVGKLV